MTVAGHESGRRYRLADESLVDGPAGRLDAPSEEGVGSRAQPESITGGNGDRGKDFVPGQTEWFLAIGVLPGFQGGDIQRRVGLGHSQVDDDFYGGIGKQIIHAHAFRNPEFRRPCLSTRKVDVRAGPDFKEWKLTAALHIGGKDGAAADDADTDGLHSHGL